MGERIKMECIECGNCKDNEKAYYCVKENSVVINENYIELENIRKSTWKKGNFEYEKHRKLRNAVEEVSK